MSKQKGVILLQDKAIEAKAKERAKYREQNKELQLQIKTLENNISKHHQDTADAAAQVFQNGGFPGTL